jgi:hypothetical protein
MLDHGSALCSLQDYCWSHIHFCAIGTQLPVALLLFAIWLIKTNTLRPLFSATQRRNTACWDHSFERIVEFPLSAPISDIRRLLQNS